MKTIIFTLCLFLCFSSSAQVIKNPAVHDNMIIGKTWGEIEIQHSTGYPVENCNSSKASESQCYFALSEGVAFPYGAKSIDVLVKAKAWYKGSS